MIFDPILKTIRGNVKLRGATNNNLITNTSSGSKELLDVGAHGYYFNGTIWTPRLGNTYGGAYTEIIDSAGDGAGVDETTHSLQIIDAEHHEIHEGEHYVATIEDGLDDKDELILFIRVPSGYEPHTLWHITSREKLIFRIYEAPTTSSNGNLITAINSNRNFVDSANTVFYENPTVTSYGTKLFSLYSLGKSGMQRGISEIVLKESTDYIYVIESQKNDNDCFLNLFFYEEVI